MLENPSNSFHNLWKLNFGHFRTIVVCWNDEKKLVGVQK